MGKLLGIRAYARHRGITHPAVLKAIKSGRIPVVTDKSGKQKIDLETADRLWEEQTNPAKRRGPAPEESAKSFQAARTVKEHYQARQAKLDYERAAGLVVEKDRVKKEWFEIAKGLRAMMQNIPSRIAGELAGALEVPAEGLKVHAVMAKEINTLLEELANASKRLG